MCFDLAVGQELFWRCCCRGCELKAPEQGQRVGWASSARQGFTALTGEGPRLVPERERQGQLRSRGGGLGTRDEKMVHAQCH